MHLKVLQVYHRGSSLYIYLRHQTTKARIAFFLLRAYLLSWFEPYRRGIRYCYILNIKDSPFMKDISFLVSYHIIALNQLPLNRKLLQSTSETNPSSEVLSSCPFHKSWDGPTSSSIFDIESLVLTFTRCTCDHRTRARATIAK